MASFSEWYEKNKSSYNAKRKKRYAEDPAYREKMIKSTRNSRKKKDEPKQGELDAS